eukprot:19498-Eustigmatos_ZCMA.PRE.1
MVVHSVTILGDLAGVLPSLCDGVEFGASDAVEQDQPEQRERAQHLLEVESCKALQPHHHHQHTHWLNAYMANGYFMRSRRTDVADESGSVAGLRYSERKDVLT